MWWNGLHIVYLILLGLISNISTGQHINTNQNLRRCISFNRCKQSQRYCGDNQEKNHLTFCKEGKLICKSEGQILFPGSGITVNDNEYTCICSFKGSLLHTANSVDLSLSDKNISRFTTISIATLQSNFQKLKADKPTQFDANVSLKIKFDRLIPRTNYYIKFRVSDHFVNVECHAPAILMPKSSSTSYTTSSVQHSESPTNASLEKQFDEDGQGTVVGSVVVVVLLLIIGIVIFVFWAKIKRQRTHNDQTAHDITTSDDVHHLEDKIDKEIHVYEMINDDAVTGHEYESPDMMDKNTAISAVSTNKGNVYNGQKLGGAVPYENVRIPNVPVSKPNTANHITNHKGHEQLPRPDCTVENAQRQTVDHDEFSSNDEADGRSPSGFHAPMRSQNDDRAKQLSNDVDDVSYETVDINDDEPSISVPVPPYCNTVSKFKDNSDGAIIDPIYFVHEDTSGQVINDTFTLHQNGMISNAVVDENDLYTECGENIPENDQPENRMDERSCGKNSPQVRAILNNTNMTDNDVYS